MNRLIRLLAAVVTAMVVAVTVLLLLVVFTGTQEAITRLSVEVQIEAYCARHMDRLARHLNVTAGPGACTLEYIDHMLGTSDYAFHFNRLNADEQDSVGLILGPASLRFTPDDAQEILRLMLKIPAFDN